jgi:hypothetical protein
MCPGLGWGRDMADSTTRTGQDRGVPAAALAVILLVAALLGLALLFDWWPILRGGFGWSWDHVSSDVSTLLRLMPAIAILLIYGISIALLRGAADWLFLTWCILGAVAVPVSLLGVLGDPLFVLFSRTVSQYATGPFVVSLSMKDPASTVAQWPAAMPGFFSPLPHMSTMSPLWAVLYHVLQRLLEQFPSLSAWLALRLIPLRCQDFSFLALDDAKVASAWLGILSPLWAAMTAIPLFVLGKQIGDRTLARRAVSWWPLIPALTMFAATLSAAYLPFAVAAISIFWALLRSPGDRIPWHVHLLRFLVGFFAGLLTLWNFSLIPLLAFMGILTLLRWQWGLSKSTAKGFTWPLLVGLELAAGAGLAWGLYTLWAGHSPLQLLRVSMDVHLNLHRPYWPWLALHTWDLILFLGLPICGLAIVGALIRRDAPFRQYTAALGLTLAILVLSGTAQGETGRIWMYFMPLILLVAAAALGRMKPLARCLLAASQVLWLLVLAAAVRTVVAGDVRPPPTFAEVTPPAVVEPHGALQADFGNQLRLLGYQSRYQPETHSLKLALHWEGLQQMREPYYFSVVAVAPDGAALPARQTQPFATRFPTTCWPRGQEVIDHLEVPLGQDPPQGNWWVSLSVFELRENQPPVFLPVRLPDGRLDQQVGLGPLKVNTGE